MRAAPVADAEARDVLARRIDARRNRARAIRYAAYAVVLTLVVWSVDVILVAGTDWHRMSAASVAQTIRRFAGLDVQLFPDLLDPALETVLMATLATIFGMFLAVPVAWLGAMNITPLSGFSYLTGRSLMTLSRSVHEIVWGLIFVAAVGLGALAGILAMAVRSVGFISKTVAEAIEDVDPGPIEAMRAVGASKFQILIYAIVPQVLPIFFGNVVFEWDVNVRRSTIMGLVGAGGLGLALHRQMVAYNYGGITTVIVVVLVLITAGEIVSYYARKSIL